MGVAFSHVDGHWLTFVLACAVRALDCDEAAR